MSTEYTSRGTTDTTEQREVRSVVPDLTPVTEQLLLIDEQLTTRPSAWNTSSDEILTKIDRDPGFTSEELEDAGFRIITKRPLFDDSYIFQY